MNKLNKKGFTLIEVVLVLAIGGLIFLLAFVAFQQVSRNRRDTQRRADAARVVAELDNYKGDKGDYPLTSTASDSCSTTTPTTSFGVFLKNNLCKDGAFKGPVDSYTVAAGGVPTSSALSKDQIRYSKNSNCADGASGVRVEIGLETGATICRDNQ